MVSSFTILVALATAASVHSAPTLNKRIAQNIPESTAKWEQACLAAGGGQKCNPVSVTAFTTLLAAAGPCEQQDAGDQMIDLAKTLTNNAEMIKLTQIFVQQPRNSPNSVSIPYCQKAPKNSELNGLFQCQFQGSNPTTFVGGVQVGAPGTVPFGLTAPLSPAGSCPASKTPIADGKQLVAITQNPGTPSTGGGTNNGGAASSAVAAPSATASSTASSSAAAPAASTSPTTGAGGFKLQNGQAAQALNAKFASLTADSACTAGENACVAGGFAQCVNGKFVVTQCSGGLKCFALPLVNSPGTSITCDTEADALARIATSGATGGLTGSGATQPGAPATATAAPSSSAPAQSAAPPAAGTGFKTQNGKDAQALNAKFAKLTANSACTAGENACVNGGFAQCVNGKFVVTGCAGGLKCFALPLVNSKGTSVTCDTEADALARIANSGATGGLTG